MLFLLRRKYPDRMMDEDELDAVAALWRAWYAKRHKSIWGRREAYQFLEIRLWGFARSRSKKLLGLLGQRLSEYGLSEVHVELLDPDTIKVTSPSVPTSELLPPGLWLDLFGGEEFSGLLIMVRLTISEHQEVSEDSADHSAKLVLVGEIQQERLQLKAVWPNVLRKSSIEQLYHKPFGPMKAHSCALWMIFARRGELSLVRPLPNSSSRASRLNLAIGLCACYLICPVSLSCRRFWAGLGFSPPFWWWRVC